MLIRMRYAMNRAIIDLQLWETTDPVLLAKLLDSWYWRPLLTDREAEEVVRFVAANPI